MIDAVHRWGPVVLAAIAAVPLAVLVTWALARWRGHWRDPALEVGMVFGTAPWLWMLTRPQGVGHGVNLVPFTDLAIQLADEPGFVVVQLGGNLLVFAALGFCLPMRWAAFAGSLRLLAVGVAGSILVEALQYAMAIGRYSSIDDVLVNGLGALLAGLCSRRWWRRRPPLVAAAGRPDQSGSRPAGRTRR